ncbi:MAG: RrF2 family transcriptional regulator [Acidobacteriota bacterium]
MIYTDSCKYAIRAMIHIATHREDPALVTAGEIAEAEEIPPYYLAKILQDLARARLLKSVRGRGGGFSLSRQPLEIPVIEIVEAVEDTRRLKDECILGLEECNDDVPCPLHRTWSKFRDSCLDSLQTLTLADLELELQKKQLANRRAEKG